MQADWQKDMRVYLVIGPTTCDGRDPLQIIAQAYAAGVRCVQWRDKTSDLCLQRDALKRIKRRFPGLILIINDHVELANQLYLPLHIGQNDMAWSSARMLLGDSHLLGLSIRNIEDARRSKGAAVDYFGVGPVFTTKTKRDATPPIGLAELEEIVDYLAPTPCIAIGGITHDNVQAIMRTGVAGVAVISAITAKPCPFTAAKALLRLTTEALVDERQYSHDCRL